MQSTSPAARRSVGHSRRIRRSTDAHANLRSVAPSAECETRTRYLDLDGDGVPDAVEMIEMVVVPRGGANGGRRVLHTSRTVAAGIGIEGVPRRVFSTSSR
jgi:hypothetical protein